PVPASQMNAALAALDQGLSERAGIPKPPDKALYADVGSIQPSSSADRKREYAPVNDPLRAYVAARWRESKSDPLRCRLALRANVSGAEEHLSALAAAFAHSEKERKA